KEGYPVNIYTGCKYSCWLLGENEYCIAECKEIGAGYGYCHGFGCWCEQFPENKPSYPYPEKSCGRK
uniref:Neurotoxin Cex11 n=1 Tax=Centruroides exilicauda TaxID=6879 RepID=SCX11_CENEX